MVKAYIYIFHLQTKLYLEVHKNPLKYH